jgi:hypothetical protein
MVTPVPGGVGPMTIAMLLYNTLQSGKRHITDKPKACCPMGPIVKWGGLVTAVALLSGVAYIALGRTRTS